MANPQQNQPQQQNQQGEYKPHKNTIWLCETRDRFQRECRLWLEGKFQPLLGSILSQIPTDRIKPEHEIVVLYRNAQTYRPEGSKTIKVREEIAMSRPIPCAPLYIEAIDPDSLDATASLGGIRISNSTGPDGRAVKGLCQLVLDACKVKDRYGRLLPTVRAVWRPDERTIRIDR